MPKQVQTPQSKIKGPHFAIWEPKKMSTCMTGLSPHLRAVRDRFARKLLICILNARYSMQVLLTTLHSTKGL